MPPRMHCNGELTAFGVQERNEWIGDALGAVVAGTGSIEYLPCKS